MKCLKLFVALMLVSVIVQAQKSKVQTAWNHMKYQEWDKAQIAIDEAILNEQTSGSAKTWVYRGQIYSGILKDAKFAPKYPTAAEEALKSYKKAMELDPKNEWAQDIAIDRASILNAIFNKALVDYKAKNYADALVGFETVSSNDVKDTAVIFNCALAAEGSKQTDKAKMYYEKLISMNYNSEFIYIGLSTIYINEKNETGAEKIIENGLAKYPENTDLMNMKMNLIYKKGNDQEALNALNAAIAKDPKNPSNYYNAGVLYSRIANPLDANGKPKTKPANYSELNSKAIDSYKKAIELNPDYFDANYNLGALYFNQGAELVNQANDLPPTKQKEYDALTKKSDEMFLTCKPYFEKAYQLNPKDIATLQSLKQLYVRTNETEKYNKIKAELDGK